MTFTQDNTVNVIASAWFKDGQSWWPNYKSDSRINKAVQNCEEPGPGWDKYSVRIICDKGNQIKYLI